MERIFPANGSKQGLESAIGGANGLCRLTNRPALLGSEEAINLGGMAVSKQIRAICRVEIQVGFRCDLIERNF
jgi:hypothetical protein